MTTHLTAAAARRHEETLRKATAALQQLSRAGAPINFVVVARQAGCSTDFLYRNPELRARIEDLRSATAGTTPRPLEPSHGGVATSSAVRTLSAQLKRMRAEHHAEVARLQKALAVAHGEILRLRRLPSPGSAAGSTGAEASD